MKPEIKKRNKLRIQYALIGNPFKEQGLATLEKGLSYPGYSPIAPVKEDIRRSIQGAELQLGGYLRDRDDNPLRDKAIEIWHLSPNSNKLYHRAKLFTDKNGAYQFITDLPGRDRGKNFCLYFKVEHLEIPYFTKLSFNHARAWLAARSGTLHIVNGMQHLQEPSEMATQRSRFHFDIRLYQR